MFVFVALFACRSLDNFTSRSTVSLRMGTFCNNELGVLCSSAKTPSICRGITGRCRHYFNCSCALCSIASTRPCVVIISVLCSSAKDRPKLTVPHTMPVQLQRQFMDCTIA